MNTEFAKGIDVSNWQGTIGWSGVASAETRFAFVKATEGATWTDAKFAFNREAAAAVGIACGAYHFLRATSKVEAQVDHFVSVVGRVRKGELPPVLDVEDPGQWKGHSKESLTNLVLQWLRAVEARFDVKPLVYLSPSFAKEKLLPLAELADYPLWIAHWTDRAPSVPAPWQDWLFWQYSSKGKLPGITENVVDLDYFNGSDDALNALVFRR